MLVGAILTASISEWQSAGGKPLRGQGSAGIRLIIAVQVLAILYKASRDGAGAVHRSRILRQTDGGGEAVDVILSQLRGESYVERTLANRWILARDSETVTLLDLYHVLGLGFTDSHMLRGKEPWRQHLAQRIDAVRDANKDVLGISLKDVLEAKLADPNSNTVKDAST